MKIELLLQIKEKPHFDSKKLLIACNISIVLFISLFERSNLWSILTTMQSKNGIQKLRLDKSIFSTQLTKNEDIFLSEDFFKIRFFPVAIVILRSDKGTLTK